MAVADNPSTGLGSALFDETVQRIRELNERLLEFSVAAGRTTMEAYEKALSDLASAVGDTSERGVTQLDWLAALAEVHAEFVREVSTAYTAGLRVLLD